MHSIRTDINDDKTLLSQKEYGPGQMQLHQALEKHDVGEIADLPK